MSIVVFYLRLHPVQSGDSALCDPMALHFTDKEMSQALSVCQTLRADPMNSHVTISSQLDAMVGMAGVSAVENGKTPDGQAYEWSKAGRAGAVRRHGNAAAQQPTSRKDMDQ